MWVTHWLAYLGFVQPGTLHIGDFIFVRFVSFASEPSVLVYSFLVPGLLALTFRGLMLWSGVPILIFSMPLAASGTIWLSLALGIIAFPVMYAYKRVVWVGAFLPVAAVVGFFLLIHVSEISEIVQTISALLQPLSDTNSAFEKPDQHRSGLAA